MNTVTDQKAVAATPPIAEEPALPVSAVDTSSTSSLVLDGMAMERMIDSAKLMASAKVTIPKHLQGSTGDCLAVIMQAMQWKMNPFAVAQKTHLSQSGALGYEAQLVNAVIVSSGAIVTQPEFEFIGDWKKILGKVKEMKSDRGGKYYVSDWKTSDEDGLGVICRARLRGETEKREITVMMSQAWPRFSTQWATDPQQQITYLAVRKFARRYAPGAILGVYTPEELEEIPTEKDVTPVRHASGAAAAKAARDTGNPDDADAVKRIAELEDIAKKKGQVAFREAWKATPAKVQSAIGIPERNRLDKLGADHDQEKVIQGEATTVQDSGGAPEPVTMAQVEEKLNKAAGDIDLLDAAADLIQLVEDSEERDSLSQLYHRLRDEARNA